MKAHQLVALKGIEEVKFILKKAPPTASLCRITPKGNCLYYRIEGHEYQVYFPLNSEWWFSSIQEPSEFLGIEELKQVVESLDTVAKHGGLFYLKCQIEKGGYDFEWYGENGEFGFTDLNVLEKAIADYELVESYKEIDHE